jgi:hypothetical protein
MDTAGAHFFCRQRDAHDGKLCFEIGDRTSHLVLVYYFLKVYQRFFLSLLSDVRWVFSQGTDSPVELRQWLTVLSGSTTPVTGARAIPAPPAPALTSIDPTYEGSDSEGDDADSPAAAANAALVWQLATVTLTAETVAVCATNAAGTSCVCVLQQPVDAVASLRLLPAADKSSTSGCQLALLFDADQTDDARPWVLLFKTPNARAQFATALNEQWKALYAVNLPTSK